MTTDPGESTTELEQQIAKLMAALMRAAAQPVPPNSPRERERGHGRDGQTGVLLATPAPIMTILALDRPTQTAAHVLAMGQELPLVETRGRTAKGLTLGMKVQPTGGTPTLSSALHARAVATWLGNVPLQLQL